MSTFCSIKGGFYIKHGSSRPEKSLSAYEKKSFFFKPKEFSAHLNSSHFLTLDIAMQKIECKIKSYFNYPEKNGKILVMKDDPNNIDLTSGQRKIVDSLLNRYASNTEVWAFGSRVKWTSRPDSDLDIVVFATPEQSLSISNLKEAFEESDLPFRIDCFIWNEIPEQFHENIKKEHIILQTKKEPNIASGWKKYSLTDIYDISSGLSKPAKDFGSGYPFLAFKDVFNNFFVPDELSQLVQSSEIEREKCSVRRGDVFITRTSETMHELGMSCVALKDYENATFNGFTKRLRGNSKAEIWPEYIGYCLRSPKFRNSMTAFSTMSTRASLNNQMIGLLKLTVPPIKEQKSIAHILKSLDDKIELNRKMNETLEQMAQALFKSWFVDFDSVIDNAILAGNPIPDQFAKRAEIRKKALNEKKDSEKSEFLYLFPNEFELSDELGWIPKGWEVGELGNIIKAQGGFAFKSKDFTDRGLPVIKIKNINSDGTVDMNSVQHYNGDLSSKLENFILNDGDIIIAMTGATVGKSGVVVNQESKALLNQRVARFLNEDEKVPSTWFSYLLIRRPDKFAELVDMAMGSAQPNISSSGIESLMTVIPSREVLIEFHQIVNDLFNKMILNQKMQCSLSRQRDTLLPKLLSGELTLSDIALAESEIEDAEKEMEGK